MNRKFFIILAIALSSIGGFLFYQKNIKLIKVNNFGVVPCKDDIAKSLDDRIRNCPIPANERANFKSREIAKFNFAKYTDSQTGITIEIKDGLVKEIDGGIELYARAWRGANQLGFGKKGTIEWERFIFINPPVLVNDTSGTIVREQTDPITGEIKTRKLREDPVAATKSSLARTIKVSSKEGTKIVKGSVGDTTSTFRPDSGDPAASAVDGTMFNSKADAAAVEWSAIRATGSADLSLFNGTDYNMMAYGDNSSANNLFRNLMRSRYSFLTGPTIPDTDTIDSATLNLRGTGKTDPKGDLPNIDIYNIRPATTTALTAADFDQYGSSSLTGSPIAYNSWATTSTNAFVLNAEGLGLISATSTTNLGARNANFDASGTVPTFTGGSQDTTITGYFADQVGTDDDPNLVVVHTGAGGGGVEFNSKRKAIIIE